MESYNDREIQQMKCGDNSLMTGSLNDGDYGDGGKKYLVRDGGSVKFTKRKSRKVQVQVINLKEWLRDLGLNKLDSVILKIDVEGSEFSILPELMTDQDLFCLVDLWHVEFHLGSKRFQASDMRAIRKSFLDKVKSCGKLYGHWD